jgi:nucleoside-diphosphate-sugar epimerase
MNIKKKVLITGAEGFIGSHIVEKFINLNFDVYALILYNSFGAIGNLNFLQKKDIKKINIIFGDLRDENTYIKILKRVDYVINLASLISIPYSYLANKSYFENNIIGSSNLFRACLGKKNIKKIIHFSSSEVYGTPKRLPITENFSFNPQSPYAASKASADHIAKSFYYSYDLPVTILRPFNNFGPRQSRRAVIPEIIFQALKYNKVGLGDVSTKRDFLFVEDTVNAVIKIVNSKKKYFFGGGEINIGTGSLIKIKEVVLYIKKILKKDFDITIDKKKIRPKKSEVKYLQCNYYKSSKILNWKPKFKNKKNFFLALKITVDFYKKNFLSLKNNSIYFD